MAIRRLLTVMMNDLQVHCGSYAMFLFFFPQVSANRYFSLVRGQSRVFPFAFLEA